VIQAYKKYLLTALVVFIAMAAVSFKYNDYITNPWTRNGQVMSYVIQITARVTGPIINLPIVDNQLVEAGDILFKIDPRTFQAQLNQAKATYDKTLDDIVVLEKQVDATKASVTQAEYAILKARSELDASLSQLKEAQAQYQRNIKLFETGATSEQRYDELKMKYEVSLANKERFQSTLHTAESSLTQAQANHAQAQANLGAPGEKNARLRSASALVEQAQLNLEFTTVIAPVSGYVTNLNIQLGSHVVANQPNLALIDANNYWVTAYFRETLIAEMSVGDPAKITLMSYPNTPITGKINSLGGGIAQTDGSSGYNLLPNVSPTFEWIRLAQRIPVRIHIDKPLPENIKLRIGTTASVLINTE